jgi:NitT/TauT family transport system ATP-binding protein
VFDGERITGAEQKVLHPGLNRRIGYVTQDDNLLPWRTTIDNVLFPLEVQGTLDAARAHPHAGIDRCGRARRFRALLSA